MLVVGGYDMAAVALPHVHKVDFQYPFGLHLRFFDISVGIAATHFDVFHLFFVFGNDFFNILVARYIGFDKIAKQQFFDEGSLLFPCLCVGLDTFQLYRRIDRVSRSEYFCHKIIFYK